MAKGIKIAVSLVFSFIFLSAYCFAQSGNYTLGSDMKLNGDIVKIGNIITNDGTITGDAVFFGGTATNNGNVGGDFAAFSSDTICAGTVGGNVRGASGSLYLNSIVLKNVSFAAAKINFDKNTVIDGSVYLAAGTININGRVKGRTFLCGNTVSLSGVYDGDVTVWTGDNNGIIIADNTVIKGTLNYYANADAVFPEGADINAYTFHKVENGAVNPMMDRNGILRIIFTSILILLLGLILNLISPEFFAKKAYFIRKRFLLSSGIGILVLVAALVAAATYMAFCVLGIFAFKMAAVLSVGAVLAGIFAFLLLFSEIPFSLWLGSLILRNSKSNMLRFTLGYVLLKLVFIVIYMLSGIYVISLVMNILYWALYLVVFLCGTGAVILTAGSFVKAANAHEREKAEK